MADCGDSSMGASKFLIPRRRASVTDVRSVLLKVSAGAEADIVAVQRRTNLAEVRIRLLPFSRAYPHSRCEHQLNAFNDSHRLHRHLVSMKIRPDVRATMAAGSASEAGLKIAQPEIVRPLVPADGDGMAALVIAAIDQQGTPGMLA
jgi:hypothetical protein